MVPVGDPNRRVFLEADVLARVEMVLPTSDDQTAATSVSKLLGALFSRQELADNNAMGENGRTALDRNKVEAIIEWVAEKTKKSAGDQRFRRAIIGAATSETT
ncbi:uncharacterized protein LOC144915106 [Branchiostoma floridae x Branchiostoma belcheri]